MTTVFVYWRLLCSVLATIVQCIGDNCVVYSSVLAILADRSLVITRSPVITADPTDQRTAPHTVLFGLCWTAHHHVGLHNAHHQPTLNALVHFKVA